MRHILLHFKLTHVRIVVTDFRRIRGCRSHKGVTSCAVHEEHLVVSNKHRLYLIHMSYIVHLGLPTSDHLTLLPSRGIVVEPSLSSLAADCPFFSTQALTLYHPETFFCFRYVHTCIQSIWLTMLSCLWLQEFPAIRVVWGSFLLPLYTDFSIY